MIEFTCCICEFKFTKLTGDIDERICNECAEYLEESDD